jgi:hypothetical protein
MYVVVSRWMVIAGYVGVDRAAGYLEGTGIGIVLDT